MKTHTKIVYLCYINDWCEKMNIEQGERTDEEMMNFINGYESDDDDSFVNFIISIYESPECISSNIRYRQQFEKLNKYIDNLYHGYYIYLLWEQ